MTDRPKVFVNDPIQIARDNQRHAVKTAIGLLRADTEDPATHALHVDQAVATLYASARRCVKLDTRPLDVDRVQHRIDRLWALLTDDREPVIAEVA